MSSSSDEDDRFAESLRHRQRGKSPKPSSLMTKLSDDSDKEEEGDDQTTVASWDVTVERADSSLALLIKRIPTSSDTGQGNSSPTLVEYATNEHLSRCDGIFLNHADMEVEEISENEIKVVQSDGKHPFKDVHGIFKLTEKDIPEGAAQALEIRFSGVKEAASPVNATLYGMHSVKLSNLRAKLARKTARKAMSQ